MLGITIGIAAVICVVAYWQKPGQARVEQQLGPSLRRQLPCGSRKAGPGRQRVRTPGQSRDAHAQPSPMAIAIMSQIPLIVASSPNVDGSIQIIYGNEINWFTSYRGVSPPSTSEDQALVRGPRRVLLFR